MIHPLAFLKNDRTTPGNHTPCHTSFLWQVSAQKVIFSPCCWNETQHVLEQVPLKSPKLSILVFLVDFIGTFLGTRCEARFNIPVQKKAKCKHKNGCHEMSQRLFSVYEWREIGSEKYWEECDWFNLHFKGNMEHLNMLVESLLLQFTINTALWVVLAVFKEILPQLTSQSFKSVCINISFNGKVWRKICFQFFICLNCKSRVESNGIWSKDCYFTLFCSYYRWLLLILFTSSVQGNLQTAEEIPTSWKYKLVSLTK